MKRRPRAAAARPAHDYRWEMAALVVILTVAAFLPTLVNGWVKWDDEENFLSNPAYRGLGWAQLKWMFTAYHMGHWIPLTWLTLGADYVLWGMDASGYHLTALLLHAGVALAFYLVTVRLLAYATTDRLAQVIGAAGAALLFAVHPLRVESVAWVTERRDVLSGLFSMLAILAYLRWIDDERAGGRFHTNRWYWLAVLAFAAALVSKSMSVCVPIALVLLDVYPLRRLSPDPRRWFGADARRAVLEKVPFFVLAVAIAVVALLAILAIDNLKAVGRVTLVQRLAITAYSMAFYPWKTVAPFNLAACYELPFRIHPLEWPYLVSYAFVAALTVAVVLARRRQPGWLMAWIFYAVSLIPVGGLLQNGPQIAADRYTYLPILGFTVMVGAGLARACARWRAGVMETSRAWALGAASVAVTVTLMALTWLQLPTWRDTEALWVHAIRVAPSAVALSNLGDYRLNQGRYDEALSLAERSLEFDPGAAVGHNVAALVKEIRHDREGGRRHLYTAIEYHPKFVAGYNNLGAMYFDEQRWFEALDNFQKAYDLSPTDRILQQNIVAVLLRIGMAPVKNEDGVDPNAPRPRRHPNAR